MKVLFDHNIPKRLRRLLIGHYVQTAGEMGWSQLENGNLLQAAERAGFTVMILGDKSLSYQQNLKDRKIALIVIGTTDWNILKHRPEAIVQAVEQSALSSFQVVSI